MHGLYKLKDNIVKELEEYGKTDLSKGSLDTIDKLAHAAKNVAKVIECCEDDEYSNAMGYSRGGGYSRRMSYDDGHRDFVRPDGSYRYATPEPASYARGRGRGAKRDAMGRYSSADNEVIEGLMKLADHAPDEQTRNEIMKLMDRM